MKRIKKISSSRASDSEFQDVEVGQSFVMDDHVYMRLDTNTTAITRDGDTANAVRLSSGGGARFVALEDEEEVSLVNEYVIAHTSRIAETSTPTCCGRN